MVISDFDKDIPHRNCALRAAAPSPDNFALCTEIFTLSSGCSPSFGQQLISQEILLLPLIYRAKLSDIEASGNLLITGSPRRVPNDTVFRLLSFPVFLPHPLLFAPRSLPPCNSRRPLFQSSAGKFTMRSRRRILLLKLLLPHNFHLLCSPYVENYILCGYCPRHGICL